MNDSAVVFDMDGVLVDSYRPHFESWREMAQEHGVDMTEEQFASCFGRTTREIIVSLWGDHVTDEDVPMWDERKEEAYRRILAEDFPEMDGAHELLTALHSAGFKLAIGSSGPPENVAAVIEHLPAGDLFDAAVNSTDVTHGKPHPEVFLKAAEKLGVAPARCAVVEDAPAGVEAARRAGMAAIAITGTAPRDTLAARADLVVDSLRQLTPETIAQLIAGAC